MNHLFTHARCALIGATVALFTCTSSFAETFPTRPMRLVVPFSPGGAADVLGRAVADRMSKTLKQPMLVENRPGAGGAIAAEYVARSPADGYTMMLAGTTTLVLHPLLRSDLNFDVQRDFSGVGMVAFSPLVLVVDAKAPYSNVKEFIAAVKKNPNSMNFGSAGNGSSLHIAGELFKDYAAIDLLHVPYKGSPPALNGLMGGEVHAVFDLVATAKPLVEGNRLKALGVTSAKRSNALPDTPSLHEAGFENFDFSPHYSIIVPNKTPEAVIEQLNNALNSALKDPSMISQMQTLALDLTPGSPGAVSAYVENEQSKLRPIIRARGIKLEP